MPLYEYACRKCEHTFETLVTQKTADTVRCPECDATDLEKLIALPAAGRVVDGPSATNCRGDGPPCGAPWCGRKSS
ncbi:MAG: FmdB family zinc ribbon protein [Gemmata sp.]